MFDIEPIYKKLGLGLLIIKSINAEEKENEGVLKKKIDTYPKTIDISEDIIVNDTVETKPISIDDIFSDFL